MDPKSKQDLDNHANQINPNNDAYWQSRGEEGAPPSNTHDDDDDDEDDKRYDDYDNRYDDRDDNESFSEEWVPQDAW